MQSSYTIHITEDVSAHLDIASFGSAEVWQEENFTNYITEDVSAHLDIASFGSAEVWQEENFTNYIDDEADGVQYWVDWDIPEDWQEDDLMDTMDDDVYVHVPEPKMAKHFIYGAIRNVSLHHAWLSDQAIPVPSQQPFKHISTRKVSIPEWIFLVINVLMELVSAAFDQLSSVNKPQYALIAMLVSFMATLTCIIELAYKAGKERVVWKWESKLPWFYHQYPSKKPFGTFPEMIGLVCAILQTTLSAVAYTFYLQHSNYPLKVSFWQVVFALGLFCSKFM